jgi:hypothetical protein
MADADGYEYFVDRDLWGPMRTDISLVRRPRNYGRQRHKEIDPDEEQVIYRRTFRPKYELAKLDHFASALRPIRR